MKTQLLTDDGTLNMRLLVCGGRDFDNRHGLFRVLDGIASRNNVKAIIHGAARGADKLAGEWAKRNLVEELAFPADWERHPKAAGPIRNQQMLDEGKPTHCIAFPGGRGTADMVARAKKAGLIMWQF